MENEFKNCDAQVLKWARENISEKVQWDKGNFWKIFHSTACTTWGWNDPIEKGQYCIVFETASSGYAAFDYIPKEEYLKFKDLTKDEYKELFPSLKI